MKKNKCTCKTNDRMLTRLKTKFFDLHLFTNDAKRCTKNLQTASISFDPIHSFDLVQQTSLTH